MLQLLHAALISMARPSPPHVSGVTCIHRCYLIAGMQINAIMCESCGSAVPSAWLQQHTITPPDCFMVAYDIPVTYKAAADGSQTCLVRCDSCVARLGVSRSTGQAGSPIHIGLMALSHGKLLSRDIPGHTQIVKGEIVRRQGSPAQGDDPVPCCAPSVVPVPVCDGHAPTLLVFVRFAGAKGPQHPWI
jgi:hypothetical protein